VISYGVYLWHLPLGKELLEVLPLDSLPQGVASLTMIAIGGLAAILAAALSYYGVELWFLRRKEPRRAKPGARGPTSEPMTEPA
jgi:peptidoglycan/LPS O-acetylase OafA/YrhL